MPKFRKRPVVVEAIGVDAALSNARGAWGDLPAWLVEAYDRGDVIFANEGVHLNVAVGDAPRQMVVAPWGDWIVRGVHGEIYPCESKVFAETFVPVDDEDA